MKTFAYFLFLVLGFVLTSLSVNAATPSCAEKKTSLYGRFDIKNRESDGKILVKSRFEKLGRVLTLHSTGYDELYLRLDSKSLGQQPVSDLRVEVRFRGAHGKAIPLGLFQVDTRRRPDGLRKIRNASLVAMNNATSMFWPGSSEFLIFQGKTLYCVQKIRFDRGE